MNSRPVRSLLIEEREPGTLADGIAAGLPENYLDGKGHPCIKCGGRDRFAAWRDVSDRGPVHCRHCFTKGTDLKPGDGFATLRWLLGCDTATACKWLADWLGITGEPAKRFEPPPVVRSIRQLRCST